MINEPAQSPYDWQFQIFGFRVRVSWLFWLVTPLLGWNAANSLDILAQRRDLDSPGAPVLLAIWVAVVFVSVLIHELGHTVAFRYFGINSRIVLYHFGGLAIPTGSYGWGTRHTRGSNQWSQLIISAAGPAFQIVLAIIVGGLAMSAGIDIGWGSMVLGWFGIDYKGALPSSIALYAFIYFMMFVNVAWALLNLVPVMPLDGGQIAREFMRIYRVPNFEANSFLLSTFAAAAIALLGFQSGSQMMGIFFAVMAFNNFQSFQAMGGRGPWY